MNFKKQKFLKIICTVIILAIIFIPSFVFADDYEKYEQLCYQPGVMNAMKIVGYVILVCRWVVPFIIMVLGMVDFAKVVISNDDKAMNKATAALIRRIAAGVLVFLLPTIILAILNITISTDISLEGEGTTTIGDTNFGHCTKCMFDPENC